MERNSNGDLPRPLVAIGIYIINDKGQVLLGKRKGSHGDGEFSTPGGHLEFGETFEEAAKKEVLEETGLEIGKIELFYIHNTLRYIKSDNKHYVTLSVKTKYLGGEAEVMEPDKLEFWDWYEVNDPPTPLAEWTERALKNLEKHIDFS